MKRIKSQYKENNNKTRIDESDDKSERNKDISKPIKRNSEKSTSTNNLSEKLNEKNVNTLEKWMNKFATININDNNNESKNLMK